MLDTSKERRVAFNISIDQSRAVLNSSTAPATCKSAGDRQGVSKGSEGGRQGVSKGSEGGRQGVGRASVKVNRGVAGGSEIDMRCSGGSSGELEEELVLPGTALQY
eukprot:459165-Prorocentrum_minimum.AAC.2